MALYYQDELLTQNLHTLLGDIDPAAIELLRQRMEWVEIAAGETLMAQGGVGDSMYLSISDRLRPRHKRRYKFPSLVSYLMNVTILYSTSRQRESKKLTDLYFNPPLERVGMLQWEKFGTIVEQGHTHGVAVLSALGAAELKFFAPFPLNHPHILGQRT